MLPAALLALALVASSSPAVLAAENRQLYSIYGNLATLDEFSSSNTCAAGKVSSTARYEEQECIQSPVPFQVNGVEYNSFYIDCGNDGEGYVIFRNGNCQGSISAQYDVPQCATVVGQPSQSLRFRCTLAKNATPAPTRKNATLKPTQTPTAPTSRAPTVKPTAPTPKAPTARPTKRPTKAPTLKPTKRQPTQKPTKPLECFSKAGTTQAQCRAKLQACNRAGSPMKWSLYKCTTNNGRSFNDGGCHCQSFCGYACKNSCTKDPSCEWRPSEPLGSQCIHKILGLQPAKPSCLLGEDL